MARISDLLRRKGNHVHVVAPNECVARCAGQMTQHGIGSLVVAEGGRPVGIVTWHDILAVVGRQANGLDELPVREIMSAPLETMDEQADLDEAKKRMVERRIRHMPILRGQDVVGLVTLIDVLQLHVEDASAWNEQLEAYIYGP